MNLFENSVGQNLPEGFGWLNEPEEWGFDSNGRLTVAAPAKADFFADPAGLPAVRSAPFLFKTLEGDFTVSTRMEVKMQTECDSACLMVMADDGNWGKICYENSYQIPSIVSVVTRGVSDDCNGEGSRAYCPTLRITRAGDAFAFHYSFDAKFWRLKRYFSFGFAPGAVRVGVVVQSPMGEGCTAGFDCFDYLPGAVEDLRSGI
jgi:regulation of enolase protein 1 (concanavalin A-like superfamily)